MVQHAGRAQPDRAVGRHRQLPRRRRVPDPGGAGSDGARRSRSSSRSSASASPSPRPCSAATRSISSLYTEVSEIDPDDLGHASSSIDVPGLTRPARQDHGRAARRPELRHRRPAPDEFRDNVRALPWLGNLPVLGQLFRSNGFRCAADRARGRDHAPPGPAAAVANLGCPPTASCPPTEADLFLFGRVEGVQPQWPRGRRRRLRPDRRALRPARLHPAVRGSWHAWLPSFSSRRLLALAACGTDADPWRPTTAETFGEAVRQNMAVQVVDPEPADLDLPQGDGDRTLLMIDRYKTDKVDAAGGDHDRLRSASPRPPAAGGSEAAMRQHPAPPEGDPPGRRRRAPSSPTSR